jgi:hypothetical protein
LDEIKRIAVTKTVSQPKEQFSESRIVKMVIWVFAVILTQLIVNYLNMNYLKFDRINERTISLKPITLRDSFLMESVAAGLHLLYSFAIPSSSKKC